ncbi:MAG: type II/IV secretion system protein [Nitrospirae bacterium]|nr:MAG: type II/IV secretion system protein [Nitrospirota bacterium]
MISSSNTSISQRAPLGQRLLDVGLITPDQLEFALREAKREGKYLGETLEQLGFVSHDTLAFFLASETHAELVDLSRRFIPPHVLQLIPYEVARRFEVLPLTVEGQTLTIALADPYNVMAVDTVERITGLLTHVVAASPAAIREAIEQAYSRTATIQDIIDEIVRKGAVGLEETGAEAPLIRLCNQIITQAIYNRVTDIHIEPDENIVRVRMRVDGILRQEVLIPKAIQPSLIARLKLMANLNVTEKRVPQDGRIVFSAGARRVDLRVSTLPTAFGESVVLRVLDKSAVQLDFDALGLSVRDRAMLEALIARPHGIILVTGPTGSGKTTTLYTALGAINAQEKSVFTLEDPIEYHMPLVRQTQVNPEVGMTFAAGLRALLRQDPDVILVGEIRDQETADLAFRAALTGHLVFSTLHTNDAIGAIPRLVDMGVEPYLIASALIAVVGQRLVRCICPGCRQEVDHPEEVLRRFKVTVPSDTTPRLWKGTGCEACHHTGYRGRQGVYELLMIDESFHQPIVDGPDLAAIRRRAKEVGMTTMFEDGLAKALAGVTTVEEVFRVTHDAV